MSKTPDNVVTGTDDPVGDLWRIETIDRLEFDKVGTNGVYCDVFNLRGDKIACELGHTVAEAASKCLAALRAAPKPEVAGD